jgi:NTP pyrophosphatase (non-canonical NTP hydrolase)
MNLSTYQRAAHATAAYPEHARVVYPALGLASEAGEVAGKVKRIIRDDGGQLTAERRAQLVAEMGDCLWYLAALASDMGIDLADVAVQNIEKLAERAERNAIRGEGDER